MTQSLPGGRWVVEVLALGVLLALLLSLWGCDSQRIAKLEEGVSTEADVRRQFGEPVTITTEADGSRIFEYPRQPEGQTNYFITIGPDGRMSSLRQVLKDADFRRITPGMDKMEVRRILGRPARTQVFELKHEEVWTWRYLEGQTAKVFEVRFDDQGHVLDSASTDDPRATQPGG